MDPAHDDDEIKPLPTLEELTGEKQPEAPPPSRAQRPAFSDPVQQPPRGSVGSPDLLRPAITAAVALIVAFGGGAIAGWLLSRGWGHIGMLVLWPVGWLGALAIMRGGGSGGRAARWAMVAALFVAYLIAETAWILYASNAGATTWAEALRKLPGFFSTNTMDAVLGAFGPLFGAMSAWGTLGMVRFEARRSANFCPTCAYDLRGTQADVCPECGTRVR